MPFQLNTIASAKQISFDGNIVIFSSPELKQEMRQQLEDKVTDIVVKPHSPSRDLAKREIDWLELKNKSYF